MKIAARLINVVDAMDMDRSESSKAIFYNDGPHINEFPISSHFLMGRTGCFAIKCQVVRY